jgi:phage terminase Nu1 subunit (DNA packaging protein)
VDVVSSSSADEGARRADDLLRLLAEGDRGSADGLLAGLDVRELTFTGARLTVAARAERHHLPPAMRAQANSRQMRLAQQRDASRADPEGLRGWLVSAAEEVLFLRSLPRAG